MLRSMKYIGNIFWLSLFVCLASAQNDTVPNTWLGVWKLNAAKSSFDERTLVKITDQTLTISATQKELTIMGDTTLPDGRRVAETSKVQLDGTETVVAANVIASFKRIDDRSFELTITARIPAGIGIGVNRFVFSSDGKTLTETKTQTLRAAVPKGNDPEKAAVIRTSKSVLVFEKQK